MELLNIYNNTGHSYLMNFLQLLITTNAIYIKNVFGNIQIAISIFHQNELKKQSRMYN